MNKWSLFLPGFLLLWTETRVQKEEERRGITERWEKKSEGNERGDIGERLKKEGRGKKRKRWEIRERKEEKEERRGIG